MINLHLFILKKLKLKEKSDNESYFYGTQLPIIFFKSKINLLLPKSTWPSLRKIACDDFYKNWECVFFQLKKSLYLVFIYLNQNTVS